MLESQSLGQKVFSIPYSGKLLREKTFTNFAVLWLFAKVFPVKFGGLVSLGAAQMGIPQKFLCKNCIFHQFVKVFSLESFPLYSIVTIVHLVDCICVDC